MTVKKSDLVYAVSLKASIDQVLARDVVDAVLETITQSLTRGDTVAINRFGKFDVREREARVARNPRTGQAMEIPARRVVAFIPGSSLKEAVGGVGEATDSCP